MRTFKTWGSLLALLISRRQPKTKRQNAQTELGDSKVLNIVENVDGMDVGETVPIIKLLLTKEKKKKKEERKGKEKGNILDASILAKISYESCERPRHLLKGTSLYWLQTSEPRLRRSCFRARWGLTGCRDQMRVVIYCICSYTPMNPVGSLVTGTGRQCVLILDK